MWFLQRAESTSGGLPIELIEGILVTVYPALLTVEEVAEKLGLSKYQVYRRIDRGDLKVTPFRRQNPKWKHPRLLVDEASVQEYLDAGGPHRVSYAPRVSGEWMTTREAAQLLGLSAQRIRELCTDGALEYRKGAGPRGQYRISRDSVHDFLASADA